MAVVYMSNFNESNTSPTLISPNFAGAPGLFPTRLYDLLEYSHQNGLEYIIQWTDHGRAFMVHDPDKLSRLLPMFFGQTKYRSFQRQLHMWSFEKIHHGSNRGARAHPYFIRGQKSVLQHLTRDSFKRRSEDVGEKIPTSNRKRFLDELSSAPEVRECNPMEEKFAITPSCVKSQLPSSTKDAKLAHHFDSQVGRTLKAKCLKLKLSVVENPQPAPQPQPQPFQEGDAVEFEGRQFFFLDLKSSLGKVQLDQQQQSSTVDQLPDFAADAFFGL